MICILKIWRLRGKAVKVRICGLLLSASCRTKSYLEDQYDSARIESAVCEVMGKSIVVEAPSNDNDLP